jgi:hypothetical protein
MTREVVYNKYEIELLELIDYAIDFFRKGMEMGEVPKDFFDTFSKKYEFIKENVTRFANERYDIVEFFEIKKSEASKLYYDDTCLHCKFHSSFRPIGNAVGAMGFTFYLFNCPKCNKNFLAQNPFDMHENLAWVEHEIIRISKEDAHGNSIKNSKNHTPEQFENLIKGYLEFKEEVRKLDEGLAANKVEEERDIQQLIPLIAELKGLKIMVEEQQKNDEIN